MGYPLLKDLLHRYLLQKALDQDLLGQKWSCFLQFLVFLALFFQPHPEKPLFLEV